jgi:hypothetical protein
MTGETVGSVDELLHGESPRLAIIEGRKRHPGARGEPRRLEPAQFPEQLVAHDVRFGLVVGEEVCRSQIPPRAEALERVDQALLLAGPHHELEGANQSGRVL